MLYKFMGGPPENLPDVFDKTVEHGSLKFTSIFECNDPFEFKFNTKPPGSREELDAWHDVYRPKITPQERDNAWESVTGPNAIYNSLVFPRVQLMQNTYTACLSLRWNSPLMWAHYCSSHQGFVVCYKPEIVDFLKDDPAILASGNVAYSMDVPEFQWFSEAPHNLAKIMGTKHIDWSYEKEFRFLFKGEPGQKAIFRTVEKSLIAGVILGVKSSNELTTKALALKKSRPEFSVKVATSMVSTFDIGLTDVSENEYIGGSIL